MSEKKTSLEVTEAQKEKIVDLFAKEAANKNTEPKEVTLFHEHRINGIPYGPGTLKVPANIAGTLLANDQSMTTARLKEMSSDNKMIEILGRGLSRIHKGGA